jgi:hypothetical protein
MQSLCPEYIQIADAVNAIRSSGATRQEASHFVCRKLLYEMGETPTTRVVREITGWGSHSDVQQDVKSFMRALRAQGPAPFPETKLPNSVQASFLEGILEIYAHARTEASKAFDSARQAFDEERTGFMEREQQLKLKIATLEEHSQAITERLNGLLSHLAVVARANETP